MHVFIVFKNISAIKLDIGIPWRRLVLVDRFF